jgi:hypothetical protein
MQMTQTDYKLTAVYHLKVIAILTLTAKLSSLPRRFVKSNDAH